PVSTQLIRPLFATATSLLIPVRAPRFVPHAFVSTRRTASRVRSADLCAEICSSTALGRKMHKQRFASSPPHVALVDLSASNGIVATMIILATGCRSGFGKGIALAAARKGHTVYAGVRSVEAARDLVD